MHNKSMTFDNQITIVGGRNIGEEYFDARPDMNYNLGCCVLASVRSMVIAP
jgi:phosphatidylserine/phosphatidylglycerophosphate/cardiolipin synthase-like enzyme